MGFYSAEVEAKSQMIGNDEKRLNLIFSITKGEKYKIANAVSCFQWDSSEIESGEMWDYLKPVFEEELNGS